MRSLTFDSENLALDWISFNLEGFRDPEMLAHRLLKYFTPHVLIDDVPSIGFHGLKKKYKVFIRQYTGSKGYWIGTKIIFSGKNANYFYKLLKTGKFDWSVLKLSQHNLSLGRIDLCFSRPNDWSHTSKSFDGFLVDSRKQIQDHTNTRHIKLQDFPDGKLLKVNRRNNSRHYRVYQKDETVRFELELKHRQTKLVQEKKVDWEIFKLGSLSLSRFDFYYFEKINDSDKSSVKYFLQDCVKNLEEKKKNISYSLSYGKKRGGYLLRIGSRQSSKHLRIYQKRNGLEFELEIKKQETKKRESFLFSNQLKRFEDSYIRCYYEYLWNYLVFENPFTEWLVVGGRKLRMTRVLSDSLALSYLKPKLARNIYQNFDKKPETFCFIQLLSFLDQRKDKIQILERSLGFVKINFQAEDFFNFIGISLDKIDARKLAKITDIMHQQSPRMTVFSATPVEKRFQSKSMLADIKFTKIRKGPFIGEMVIAEEVYQYRYPFYLPESLLFLPTYNDYYRNYMVKIKLLFIESYTSGAVEKRMPIKDFLSQFHRSNQKIAKIKKDILIIFNDLEKKDLIDSRFKLISKTGKEVKLTKLSTSRFTEYDTICFYEKIQSKEIKLKFRELQKIQICVSIKTRKY